MTGRRFDLVLFGATGFTGGLVAEYLAQVSRQESFTWALAGRSIDKLSAVRERLTGAASVPELLVADVDDASAIRALAASAAVVITTVGPYALVWRALATSLCRSRVPIMLISPGSRTLFRAMRERYDGLAKKTGAQNRQQLWF
jgi:short subunit dehydrogenase-like uncharacterized protein